MNVPSNANRPRRLRLSLRQMMVLVVYGAVASGCVAPMVQLWQAGVVQGRSAQGLVSVAMFGAVVVPLAWVGLSFVVIRRGAWRDTVILSLLLCSVLVALLAAGSMFTPWIVSGLSRGLFWPVTVAGLVAFAINSFFITALVCAASFLMLRLRRRFGGQGVLVRRESSEGVSDSAEAGELSSLG